MTELLIVLAIIGIVAALLLPVISMIRESVWQTGCGFRMNKCATASIVFANENRKRLPRERFPEAFLNEDPFAVTPDLTPETRVVNQFPTAVAPGASIFWVEMIRPYLENNQTFNCPKLKFPATQSDGGGRSTSQPLGIGINATDLAPMDGYAPQVATHASDLDWTSIGKVPSPSQIVWFMDSASMGPALENDNPIWTERIDAPYAATLFFRGNLTTMECIMPRHRKKVNACFVDGNVANVTQNQISEVYDPTNALAIGYTSFLINLNQI